MEQFNLDTWLKDKSRKVTTRYGNRKVRIICTDRKAKLPIVALIVDMDGNEYVTYHTKNGWCDEQEKYIDKRDLFFADEEENLSEGERIRKELIEYLKSQGASIKWNFNSWVSWLEKQGDEIPQGKQALEAKEGMYKK